MIHILYLLAQIWYCQIVSLLCPWYAVCRFQSFPLVSFNLSDLLNAWYSASVCLVMCVLFCYLWCFCL